MLRTDGSFGKETLTTLHSQGRRLPQVHSRGEGERGPHRHLTPPGDRRQSLPPPGLCVREPTARGGNSARAGLDPQRHFAPDHLRPCKRQGGGVTFCRVVVYIPWFVLTMGESGIRVREVVGTFLLKCKTDLVYKSESPYTKRLWFSVSRSA